MRNLADPKLLERRDMATETALGYNTDPSKEGIFNFPSPVDGHNLYIIATTSKGWDHVSISRDDRAPVWLEMETMRRIFFLATETIIQIHPPAADYIDGSWPGGRSLNCLHLWRPQSGKVPTPPKWMVGANSIEEASAHAAALEKKQRGFKLLPGRRKD